MFHLGWFTNFMPPKSWRTNWGGRDAEDWASGQFYVDFAKSLERACFDYVMLEDSLMVPDAYGGTAEVELKHAMSTSFYPPFMLARTLSTLSHLTNGRVGWNVVTSSEHRSAQNFGMEKLWQHDDRYDRADEFVEVAELLWASWDQDSCHPSTAGRSTARLEDLLGGVSSPLAMPTPSSRRRLASRR